MPTYVSLVNVEDQTFQNVQALTSLWGELTNQIDELGVTIEESYAVLGEYDFVAVMDAPDRDSMFQVALTLEGYGLDVQTMAGVPTDHFADLVDDA